MTQEEKYKIISDDFIELIIEYNKNTKAFDQFPNSTVHIFNDKYAIVHLPASTLSDSFIKNYGYSILPRCFGLTSESGLKSSGVEKLRRLPNYNLKGQGVLVALIDTGIDYANPIFIKEDGSSKIVSLWDQTIDSTNQYPEGMFYGTEYNNSQINEALKSKKPLDIIPSSDEVGHGTAMAGITVGNQVSTSDFSGVVPDSELIVVKLKKAKTALKDFYMIPSSPDINCYQETDIMWAINYVVNTARQLGRPLSICIGLGSSQGPHDGRGSVSNYLSVVSDYPGFCVSISGGNEGNKKRHFYSTIEKNEEYKFVELNIGTNESGFTMEIWGYAPNTYSIDILTPTGEFIPRIAESLRVNQNIQFIFEKTNIFIDYQLIETHSGDQTIILRFKNPTPGTWRFRVYSKGDLTGSFHIWLPSNGFLSTETYFLEPNLDTTITSPGNSASPITVSAYDPASDILYPDAGRGFSRNNNINPELTAPGYQIIVPTLEKGFAISSGTGLAAAHTAGITAMFLEWGIIRGYYPGISTVDIKKYLIRGARRSEKLNYPNQDWGYGIIDIFNSFNILKGT